MNNIHFSPEAKNDLCGIRDYICGELENPEAAQNAVASILKRIRHLEHHARLGAKLSSVVPIESDYRFLVCGSYLAFYHVKDADVFIDRILYGRRDYLRVLFEPPDETTDQ